MNAKFKVGDFVKTIKNSVIEGSGRILEVNTATTDLQLLWGHSEPHYLFKDIGTGDFISATEGILELA